MYDILMNKWIDKLRIDKSKGIIIKFLKNRLNHLKIFLIKRLDTMFKFIFLIRDPIDTFPQNISKSFLI